MEQTAAESPQETGRAKAGGTAGYEESGLQVAEKKNFTPLLRRLLLACWSSVPLPPGERPGGRTPYELGVKRPPSTKTFPRPVKSKQTRSAFGAQAGPGSTAPRGASPFSRGAQGERTAERTSLSALRPPARPRALTFPAAAGGAAILTRNLPGVAAAAAAAAALPGRGKGMRGEELLCNGPDQKKG